MQVHEPTPLCSLQTAFAPHGIVEHTSVGVYKITTPLQQHQASVIQYRKIYRKIKRKTEREKEKKIMCEEETIYTCKKLNLIIK